MTLKQFAIAVGADTKWVKNAIAALDLTTRYSEADARWLGLARVIHATSGIALKRAYELASSVLASPADGEQVIAESNDASVQVTVDLPRYLSTFQTRLAVAHNERE